MSAQLDLEPGTPVQSATLLQDTVDQFEKVVDLERVLLRKSILKLGNDLEEACTELGMKEEELLVWEQRVVQIQQDNELKLRLAKTRLAGRQRAEGRSLSAAKGPALGFIAEGDEDDLLDLDEEEEEVDGEDASPIAARDASATPFDPLDQQMEAVQAVNALAHVVTSELAVLRRQWQALVTNPHADLVSTPDAVQYVMAESSSKEVIARKDAAAVAESTLPARSSVLVSLEQRINRLQRDIQKDTTRLFKEALPDNEVPAQSSQNTVGQLSGKFDPGKFAPATPSSATRLVQPSGFTGIPPFSFNAYQSVTAKGGVAAPSVEVRASSSSSAATGKGGSLGSGIDKVHVQTAAMAFNDRGLNSDVQDVAPMSTTSQYPGQVVSAMVSTTNSGPSLTLGSPGGYPRTLQGVSTAPSGSFTAAPKPGTVARYTSPSVKHAKAPFLDSSPGSSGPSRGATLPKSKMDGSMVLSRSAPDGSASPYSVTAVAGPPVHRYAKPAQPGVGAAPKAVSAANIFTRRPEFV